MEKEFKWMTIDNKPKKNGRYLIFKTTGAYKVGTYKEGRGFTETWDKIIAWSEIPDLPKDISNTQQIIASLRQENHDLELEKHDLELEKRDLELENDRLTKLLNFVNGR